MGGREECIGNGRTEQNRALERRANRGGGDLTLTLTLILSLTKTLSLSVACCMGLSNLIYLIPLGTPTTYHLCIITLVVATIPRVPESLTPDSLSELIDEQPGFSSQLTSSVIIIRMYVDICV